jgi:hypothetical protein
MLLKKTKRQSISILYFFVFVFKVPSGSVERDREQRLVENEEKLALDEEMLLEDKHIFAEQQAEMAKSTVRDTGI